MQPEGAIIGLPTGSIGDMAFSPDGKTIYVARGGVVAAYNAATGVSIGSWAIGSRLGGIDVSADGKYLVATELNPGPVVSGSGSDGVSEAYVYRIDLKSGSSVKYTDTFNVINSVFFDISFLPNGQALLTQDNGWLPLTTLNFETSEFLRGQESIYQSATLTATPDKTSIALMSLNSSDAPVFVYTAGKGITAKHDHYADGVMGGNSGVQAISPKGDMIAQGSGLNIYDGNLKMLIKLGERYPFLASASGVAFSPSGDKLYVLSDSARQVVVFDTRNWEVLAGYPVGGPVSNFNIFGNALLVSSDGKHIAAAGEVSVQILDLALIVSEGGTSGNDVLQGDSSDNYLFGFEGDDSLDGRGGADVFYGGVGDDTDYADNMYDQIIEYRDQGDDRVISSADRFALPYEVEVLQLAGAAITAIGNEASNTLIGSALNNHLFGEGGDDRLEGQDGDDWLQGGAGNDTLIGGKGDDTYLVDSPADVVVELAEQGRDLVNSSVSFIMGAHIEDLILADGAESLAGTGNALANMISGNAGDNKLLGMAGNDSLLGRAGNDRLDGGAGDDFIDGGLGNDLVLFDGKRSDYLVLAIGDGVSIADKRAGGSADFVINVETFRFADGDVDAAQLRASIDTVSSDWRLFVGDSFAGKIGAGGTVIGTTGRQDVTVLDSPGQVNFDSSFNRGGDVIRVPGSASNWFVARDGSNAVLISGGAIIVVPLGAVATAIVFADGVRDLRFDTATQMPMIGDQALASDFALVRAAVERPAPNVSADDSSTARMFLEPGGDAVVSGDFTVIGTAENEQLTILAGRVTLNASFIQGGDTIVIDSPSIGFTAARSGSNAVLQSASIGLVAPAGLKGMELVFDDGARTLRIDQAVGAIMLEQQALTYDYAPVAAIA